LVDTIRHQHHAAERSDRTLTKRRRWQDVRHWRGRGRRWAEVGRDGSDLASQSLCPGWRGEKAGCRADKVSRETGGSGLVGINIFGVFMVTRRMLAMF